MAERRELRVAPVMTGGTSLAVWMGGVTRELFAMVRSTGTDSTYGRLLSLTETTPVVDVITGTSAGGLNGSLLAAGLAFGVSTEQFDAIRETWMTAADLERLLRDPRQLDPPSLLKGDYFVEQITAVLETWRKAAAPGVPVADVDLVTTYTAVTPQPVFTRDGFGARLNEVVHAGTLRFRSADFGQPDIVSKLALASRTSASIPGVFEPVYLPAGASAAAAGGLDFASHFAAAPSAPTGRWAVDGGVVVNLPLGEALDRIFDREATTDVRRVVMYVCPTPRDDGDPMADDPATAPTLVKAVATVVSAPRAEGIAADVARLQANNDQVRRQRALRRTLASIIPVLGPQLHEAAADPDDVDLEGPFPNDLMTQYRALRVEESIDQMLARLRVASGGSIANEAMVRHLLRPAREALLPRSIERIGGGGRVWGWGIAPVEQAVSFGLGVVNRSLELAAWLPGGVGATTVHEQLIAGKQAIHDVRRRVEQVRALDAAYWAAWARTTPDLSTATMEQLADLATGLYHDWPYAGGADREAERDAVFDELLAAHVCIGRIIGGLEAAIRTVTSAFATSPGDDPATTATTATTTRAVPKRVAELAAQVAEEVEGVYLAPVRAGGVRNVRRQLIVAHVVQTLFLGNVTDREQPAVLLQVSWNAPNELVDREPHEKLVGTELARLGAFLKPSWRANDWCWGRMDGAARLVQLLLDPSRLLQLGLAPDHVLEQLGVPPTAELLEELAFLAPDGEQVVPDDLPALTRTLTRRLQLEIATVELPLIGAAIDATADDAVQQDHGAFHRALTAAPLTEERVPEVLEVMRIGDETVGREFGSNLTIRLATRGAGVVVNALTSTKTGVPVVSSLLRPVRGPLHGANAVIGVLAGASPLARVLTAFVLAVGGAIVGVRLAGVEVNPWLLAASIVAIAVTGAISVLRARGRRRMAAGWVAFAAFVGVVLIGPSFGPLLFDEPRPLTTEQLREDDVIVLDGAASVRITSGSGDGALIDDVELDDGGRIELRALSAEGSRLTRDERVASSAWKRWGFTNRQSAWNVAASVAAGWLLLRARQSWRAGRADGARRSAVGAAALGAMVASDWILRWWRWLLTGAETDSGAKARFLDAATWLHEQRVGLLVPAFVLAGLLTGAVWRRARRTG